MAKIKFRRDTAADWAQVNPVLAQGEPGFEHDTGRLKLGDGATAWTALAYTGSGAGQSDRLVNGVNSVVLGSDGSTTLPSGQPLLFGNGNSRIQAGMGFHINSEEGISLEAVNVADPANPVSYGWYFGTDGNLTLPPTNFGASPAPTSWPGITFSDGTFQNTAASGTGGSLSVSTGPGNVFENATGIIFNGDNFTVTDAGGNPYISAIGGGASTGNITFAGDNIGSSNNIVSITASNYAELNTGDSYIWTEAANASIQVGGAGWVFSDPSIDGSSSNLLEAPNGVYTRSGDSVICDPGMDTVIYASTYATQHTLKLLLCIEGVEDGQTIEDTQSCEMIVARSARNNGVAGSVYGLVYTSAGPLATLSARWNATLSRVEITCRPTSTTNSVSVHSSVTELSTTV